MARRLSRPERWENAARIAAEAPQELVDLQSEYQEWLDNLPLTLHESPAGQKLQEVCGLQLEEALNTVSDASGLDLPRGFGQDQKERR